LALYKPFTYLLTYLLTLSIARTICRVAQKRAIRWPLPVEKVPLTVARDFDQKLTDFIRPR